MADNVTIPVTGTGDTTPIIATDQVGTDHFQKIKIADGTADSSAMVPGSATDGLLVNLGSNNDVTVTGTVTANAGSNLNTSALATEATLSTLDGKVTACNTGAVVISSGTVTADLGANNDVTVQGEDAENAPVTAAPVQVGGRYDATPRTLGDGDVGGIALDADGAVHVSDGGNTITVDGTVTANAGTGTFTVDGSGVTQPISAASLPLPTGAATESTLSTLNGKVTACNTGSIAGTVTANAGTGSFTVAQATASNLNAQVVGAAAHSAAASGNPNLLAGIAQDTDDTAPPNRVDAEGDVTRLAVSRDGALFVRPHGPQVWSYHLNTSTAQTDASVHAAPGAGLSLYVGTITFSSGAATAINLFFEEGASTVLGPYYLEAVAGRGMAISFNPPRKITANTALTLTTSASIAHSVDVTGFTAQG